MTALPHTMLAGALQVRAEQYADGLSIGDTIQPYDRVYLDGTGWGQHLEAALAERGLALDGDQVVIGPYRRRDAAE